MRRAFLFQIVDYMIFMNFINFMVALDVERCGERQ